MSALNSNLDGILQNPDYALEYKARVDVVQSEIHTYQGRSKQYEGLMQVLSELENWLVDVFGEGDVSRLRTDDERFWGSLLLNREDVTIDDLLGQMHDQYSAWIERLSLNEDNENEGVLVVDMGEKVFLPPGNFESHFGSGNGQFETPRFDDRLRQLMGLLHEHEIFADDVIVIQGGRYERQMRQAPYVLVEIPCIGRSILVCDEVGETTFVIRGILNRDFLTKLDKEQLVEKYPHQVRRVVYHEPEQWGRDIIDALFEDVSEVKRIDVRTQEGLREAIKERVLTAEAWAAMKTKEKRQFEVSGMKLRALARKFEVEGDPVGYHDVHKELGQQIYGECEVLKIEEKREWTIEELCEKVKELKPTAEAWVAMNSKEKQQFEVGGMKLNALATKFEVEGNPVGYSDVYKELGQQIYGECEVLKIEEKREWTIEELREKVKELKPTEEAWAAMNSKEKRQFEVGGMKLTALSTKFGVEETPFRSDIHKKLGQKIYGDHPALTPDNPETRHQKS